MAVRPNHATHGLISLGDTAGMPRGKWHPEGVTLKAQPQRVRRGLAAVGAVRVGARARRPRPSALGLLASWPMRGTRPTTRLSHPLSGWLRVPRMLRRCLGSENRPDLLQNVGYPRRRF